LFFASGVNSFSKLPVITTNVSELGELKSSNDKSVKLASKITILGFSGTDVYEKRGGYFNLSQKIYNRYREFKDFQVVILVPIGAEKQVEVVLNKLKAVSNMSNWHFVFATPQEIEAVYKSMKLQNPIDVSKGSNTVYIVDKELSLRGRKGKNNKNEEEYREGYNTSMVSELHNEMTDDVRIILAEYRLALKKNNADRKKYGL
jgi:cbb3-type cytochrome oxidase cytochrome c subunit